MVMQGVLFPMAAAINIFSLTSLLIVAGLFGHPELAANVAIIQAAIVAIFLSLSGNSRSLILAGNVNEKNLLCFRIFVVLPAVAAVAFLIDSTLDMPTYLIYGLVIRKCAEWFAELQLANREKHDDFMFAFKYVLINGLSFVLLFLQLLIPAWKSYFDYVLFGWAILPLVFLGSYISSTLQLKVAHFDMSEFIPHIGSSTIVGVSMYMFRTLIVIFLGAVLAGDMFTAYALGGVLSSLYTYAFGPTLMHKKGAGDSKKLLKAVSFCCLLGGLVLVSVYAFEIRLYSLNFMYAIGLSLIGGGLMLLAQHSRLYLLQKCKKDIFVPDALVNILLIMLIPFVYYLFGEVAFVWLYLISAVLHLLFYVPLRNKYLMSRA